MRRSRKKLTTQFIHYEDYSLAYGENGRGRPLILIHGNSADKRSFRKYQTEFFTDYHSFAVDNRGHGESRSKEIDYTIEQYGRDIIRFCEDKKLGKADVIGYSDGGNVALFLAHRRPDMFRKIVCVSPNYLVSGMTDSFLKILNRASSLLQFMQKLGIDMRKKMRIMNLMLTDIGLSEKELSSIETDILLLYAQKDIVKEEHMQRIHHLLRGSSLLKIADCSHFNIMKSPGTVRAVRTWLGRD
ncbi:MAG: alpha/beta hydrolase [Spirochaetales bacterium]|nr:alpha/beta hydrolase [Spirochaetales bacterium]